MSTQYQVDLLFKAPKTTALDQLNRQMAELDKRARNIGGGDPFKPIEQGARGATGAVTGLGVAVKGLAAALGPLLTAAAVIGGIQKVFTAGAEIETQTRSIKTLTGSLKDARDIIKELQDYGAITPFTSAELIDTAKRLKAFGVQTQNVVETTKRLGDIAGATGSNLGELATAYGQVQAKGRLQGEELLQFQERGVAIGEELRKMYGDQFPKALEKGQISAKAVEVALARLTEKGGQYFGGAIAQADTLNGKLSTLQDSFQRLAANIGTALAPVFKFVIDSLNGIIERIDDVLFRGSKGLSRDIQARKEATAEADKKFGPITSLPFEEQGKYAKFLETRKKEILDRKLKEMQGPPKTAPKADLSTPALLAGTAAGQGQEDKLLKLRKDTIQKLTDLETDAVKEVAQLQRDYLKEYADARKDMVREIKEMEKDLANKQRESTRSLVDARAELQLQRDIGGVGGTSDQKAFLKARLEEEAGFKQRERDRQRSFEDKQREVAMKLEEFKVKVAETIGKINLKFQDNYGKNQLKYAETAGDIAMTAARNAGEIQLEYATKAAQVTAAAGGGGGAGGMGGFTDVGLGSLAYGSQIKAAAKEFNVDPRLYAGLVRQESAFNPYARSSAGATGLAQLMPGTAKELGVNINDPVDNLRGGAKYLRQMIDKFGGIEAGLRAYNQGPGNQQRNPAGVSKEARDYPGLVLRYARGYGFTGGGGGSGAGVDVIAKATAATAKFTGVTNECASVVKAYMQVVGMNADVMDRNAASADKMGQKMTDWSKLQPGDILQMYSPKYGAVGHTGVYTGGQNVFHQSESRGLKAGNYPDLGAFKADPRSYFIRPGGTPGAVGGGGTAPADYTAKLKAYPKMGPLLGTPNLTAELAPLKAAMVEFEKTEKELLKTLGDADWAKLMNTWSDAINSLTEEFDKQIEQNGILLTQDEKRLEYLQQGINPALADQFVELDAQVGLAERNLQVAIDHYQLKLAEADLTEREKKGYQDLLNLAIQRRDALGGQNATIRNQLVEQDALKKDPGAILTKEIATRQEKLDALMNPANQLISAADSIGSAFGQAFQDIASGSKTAGEALSGMFQSIAASFLDMAAQMLAQQAVLAILGAFGGGLGGGGADPFARSRFGGRPQLFADGGRPPVGKPSIVGEEGPELFIPGVSGTIVPNDMVVPYQEGKATINPDGSTTYNASYPGAPGAPGSRGASGIGGQGRAGNSPLPALTVPFQKSGSGDQTLIQNLTESFGRQLVEMGSIKVAMDTTVINGMEFVTPEQAQQGNQEAAQQGAKIAIAALQNSVGTRRKIGL
jgi:tape measure domain-containing protein